MSGRRVTGNYEAGGLLMDSHSMPIHSNASAGLSEYERLTQALNSRVFIWEKKWTTVGKHQVYKWVKTQQLASEWDDEEEETQLQLEHEKYEQEEKSRQHEAKAAGPKSPVQPKVKSPIVESMEVDEDREEREATPGFVQIADSESRQQNDFNEIDEEQAVQEEEERELLQHEREQHEQEDREQNILMDGLIEHEQHNGN